MKVGSRFKSSERTTENTKDDELISRRWTDMQIPPIITGCSPLFTAADDGQHAHF